MNSKFFTNQDQNTLENRMKDILEKHNIKFLEFLIGYFRISGFQKICSFLSGIDKARILVGINIDKLIYEAYIRGKEFNLFDVEKIVNSFVNEQIKVLEDEKEYDLSIDESVELLAKYIKEKKIELRVSRDKNIHAKVYILRENPKNRRVGGIEQVGSVITGSSNLTQNGLSDNFEFNVELRDSDDISFALDEFVKLWEVAVEITYEDIQKIKNQTYLKEVTPYEVYIKFLIEYFEDRIEIDKSLQKLLPKNYMKLAYQLDAVNEGISKIKKHNGFFLADVVGLGKTITASMIVKKLILDSVKGEVLVIAPPSIQKEWNETFKEFGIGLVRGYKIESIGKLEDIDPTNYELIIIDESHKFKNYLTSRYKELERICKERSKFTKKVILISATPLNNRPQDIANQLYLFQDKRDSTIPSFPNLESFFAKIYKEYQEIISNKTILNKEQKDKLKKLSQRIRDNILREVMVRRTRSDILTHSMYRLDLEKQGLNIPKIEPVIQLEYKLNDKLLKAFDTTVTILTGKLQYERYKILYYLNQKGRKKFGKLSANIFEKGSLQLATLMQLLFVKRFESSFYAFKHTLFNQISQIENLIKMFEKGKIYLGIKVDFNDIFENDDFDTKIEDLLQKGKVKEFEKDDFDKEYLKKLKQDYEYLKELKNIWQDIEEDPKLDKLKEELRNKKDKKIVIFTESKQTALYLEKNLQNFKILTVHGDNREELKEVIRENFDANYKLKKNDYNIIISTDTLSEGVNMHRSNIIYNYDIPWNATKLMQRIGRINRIGSLHDKIYIYNFIPSAKSDNLIELSKKAFVKLQTFHSTLGEDNPIYSPEEEVESVKLFEENFQEDIDEELQYLEELRELKENNPVKFNQIKKLPKKIRVQRKKDIDKTFVFIKTKVAKGFLEVEENIAKSINFLRFAKYLKADPKEKPILPLQKEHFSDVKEAIKRYNEDLKNISIEKNSIKVDNKTDKKALRILKAFFNKHCIQKEEYETLKELVTRGRYQNLSKDIVKLSGKNCTQVVKEIDEILNKLNLSTIEDKEGFSLDIDIILSESFVKA